MTEPILDTGYWKQRLRGTKDRHLHEAVFRTGIENWQAIEEKHREILAEVIQPTDAILDAGCGWGRLLDLLPQSWNGFYLGVDISPDFIDLAHKQHPRRLFVVADLLNIKFGHSQQFDYAVLISMRPMVKRNLGADVWNIIESNLRQAARNLLYLEYDPLDNGSIE